MAGEGQAARPAAAGAEPVTVTLSGCSASLLAHLAEGCCGSAADARDRGDLLARALGLLDLALKAKREGKRLTIYDPARDELSEIAF